MYLLEIWIIGWLICTVILTIYSAQDNYLDLNLIQGDVFFITMIMLAWPITMPFVAGYLIVLFIKRIFKG